MRRSRIKKVLLLQGFFNWNDKGEGTLIANECILSFYYLEILDNISSKTSSALVVAFLTVIFTALSL